MRAAKKPLVQVTLGLLLLAGVTALILRWIMKSGTTTAESSFIETITALSSNQG